MNEALKCLEVKSIDMRYFAYGSNMDVQRMQERNVSFSRRIHAFLGGYVLRFNKIAEGKHAKKGEGKGNIMRDDHAVAEGVLYDGISTEGMRILREHEKGYGEQTVTVELANGERIDAVTFVAQSDKVREGLRPTKRYLNYYLAAQDILSGPYTQMLRSVETLD